MELRSARRLRRSPPPPPHGASSGRLPRSSDRISALSDDMILLILSRLGSVRAAARTGLLSRRWRGLWTRLTDLDFCNDVYDTIKVALARFSASPVVSSIHIRFPRTHDPSSLLRAVALLSPAELMFVLKNEEQFIRPLYRSPVADVVLPCFHRVTSIVLDVGLLSIGPPPDGGEFPALEKLSLDLGTLLSRCPRLRVLGVTFRGANDPLSLHAALAELETAVAVLGLTMSLLAIETRRIYVVNAAGFGPLLHAMARLSPRKLMITQKFGGHEYGSDEFRGHIEADLPCFHSATSIEMDLLSTVRFTLLPDGEFSALDTLSLPWRCSIPDLDSLVRRCPRLRVLKVALATGDVTVHSASLQDLSVYGNMECRRIDIVAPVLKKLTLIVWTRSRRELSVSISAPMVEKVLWQRGYTTSALMFGFWHLKCARLDNRQEENTPAWIPREMSALWLDISCAVKGRNGPRLNFEKEMEKLLITNFSLLDLSLHTCGHIFGALVLRILSMRRIRVATEKLKIFVTRGDERQACPRNCPCGKPKDWSSQSIPLPHLNELEIICFNGEDYGQDFLRLISKCSPMLKRVTVKLEDPGCATEIYNIFSANPSVNCYVYSMNGYSINGELVQQPSGQHAP